MMMARKLSIYIHFPYCVRKCRYCDFVSFPCGGMGAGVPVLATGAVCSASDISAGVGITGFPLDLCDYYVREVENYAKVDGVGGRCVTSIYFGGGTPSLMPVEWVERILDAVCRNFVVEDAAEVTLEVNPATVNEMKVRDLREAGVNRISIGMQSLCDERLKFLGRIHSVGQALETLGWVKRYFSNISCDFIYAVPGQSLAEWQMELEDIVALGVPHLSLYQLIVERGTPLCRQVVRGEVKPVAERVAERMFRWTNRRLKLVGCGQYEVSNYSVSGMKSRHNVNYWVGGDYLGIGVSAAGRVYDDVTGKLWQSANPKSMSGWCDMVRNGRTNLRPISKRVRAEELVIMGLRQIAGINFSEFSSNCGMDFWRVVNREKVESLVRGGLIILKNSGIRLSAKGMCLLDAILREIVV